MPHVTATTVVPAPPDQVRALLTDPGRWATAAHVLALTPTAGGTSWQVLLNGSRCAWIQTEGDDDTGRRVFQQVDGDVEQLHGAWTLAPENGRTRITLELSFELGVDGLAPLLDPIWTQSFQAHADALVWALATATLDELGNAELTR